MDIIQRLNWAVKQKGYTQRQLAEKLNCSETTVSKWFNKPQNFRLSTIKKLEDTLGINITQVTDQPYPDSIFAGYEPHKYSFSKSLFWEYEPKNFIPEEHKEIVVSKVIDRGRINDYYAAFDACGGIDGFKEVYKQLKKVNVYTMNFICLALNIKKEELRCCTSKR